MNEKVYKTMTGAGAGNIAVGIVVLCLLYTSRCV